MPWARAATRSVDLHRSPNASCLELTTDHYPLSTNRCLSRNPDYISPSTWNIMLEKTFKTLQIRVYISRWYSSPKHPPTGHSRRMAGHGDPALHMGDRHLSASPLESAHGHEHVSTSTEPTPPSSRRRRPAIVAGPNRPISPDGPPKRGQCGQCGQCGQKAEPYWPPFFTGAGSQHPVAGSLARCQTRTIQPGCSPAQSTRRSHSPHRVGNSKPAIWGTLERR